MWSFWYVTLSNNIGSKLSHQKPFYTMPYLNKSLTTFINFNVYKQHMNRFSQRNVYAQSGNNASGRAVSPIQGYDLNSAISDSNMYARNIG